MLVPLASKESGGSIVLWGHFAEMVLKGKVTANQYKVILTDHLYPMMNCSFRMIESPSKAFEWSLNGLMSMKIT